MGLWSALTNASNPFSSKAAEDVVLDAVVLSVTADERVTESELRAACQALASFPSMRGADLATIDARLAERFALLNAEGWDARTDALIAAVTDRQDQLEILRLVLTAQELDGNAGEDEDEFVDTLADAWGITDEEIDALADALAGDDEIQQASTHGMVAQAGFMGGLAAQQPQHGYGGHAAPVYADGVVYEEGVIVDEVVVVEEVVAVPVVPVVGVLVDEEELDEDDL